MTSTVAHGGQADAAVRGGLLTDERHGRSGRPGGDRSLLNSDIGQTGYCHAPQARKI